MPYPPGMARRFCLPNPGTAQAVALELFKKIATPAEYQELLMNGGVRVVGKYGTYVVTQNGGTCYVGDNGELLATGCLVVYERDYQCVPALDQFIANYLVLKSDERFYWNTACIQVISDRFVNPKRKIEDDHEAHQRNIKTETWREYWDRVIGGR